MSELRNCPFCGSFAEMKESEPSTARFNEGAIHFAVECSNMGCECNIAKIWEISPEDAKSKWNTRATGWVSVDDARPDITEGNKILCFGHGCVFESQAEDGIWTNVCGDDFTHWMPLPELPNADNPA